MAHSGHPIAPGATEESQLRLRLAQHMVAGCPAAWDLELALSGSASRGLADVDSDIELNAWGHDLPRPEERAAWLRALGATEITLGVEVTDDGTTWDHWRFREVWVEAGWQSIPVLEASLHNTLRGETVDHAHLMLAEVVAHALPLRTTEALHAWQAMLTHYPDVLRQRLIDSAVARWTSSYTAITRWAPVRRDQPLALTEEIVGDVHAVLRLLFTVNREWEPDWKWIAALSARLTHKPEQLTERLAACFGEAPARERMRTCTQLIPDTLVLVPATPDVVHARAHLQRGLEAN